MRAMIRVALVVACLAATGTAKADGQADAGKAWTLGQVKAMAAVTPSIEAAQAHTWLIIPLRELNDHFMPLDVYAREIAPQLDLLAGNWLPALKRDLTERLHAVSYDALQTLRESRRQISYCDWIKADNDGRGPPPLVTALLIACRDMAPEIVSRLLMRHADSLNLSLAELPRLDPTFPGWVTADLGKPDRESPAVLDPLRVRQAYLDRLGARLQAAEPGLERQLDTFHSGEGWAGERIAAPAETCAALLGPLQAGADGPAQYEPVRRALTAQCAEGARTRLMRLLPRIQAALPQALATQLPASGPLRSPGGLCSGIMGGWLGQGDYPAGFRPTLDARCADDAVTATAAAIAARVEQLAAPLLLLPRTLGALTGHAWFGPTSAQLEPLTLPDDPGRADLLAQFMIAFTARLRPAALAGVEDAKTRIAAAYVGAAGSAAAFRDVLGLCGPDGTGAQLPSAGRGSEAYRSQVVAACAAGHQAFPGARVSVAQARMGAAADPAVKLLLPTDNGEVVAVLQDLVARAALAGVQLRITSGTLGFRQQLEATPMGADAPSLSGPVMQVPQGWRLSAFEALPDWKADAADTVACLALSDGDIANTQVEAFFLLFAANAAADDDRPRTAGRVFRRGFEQLRKVDAMKACQEARGSFVGLNK